MKPVLYAANVSDSELAGDEGPHLTALREAVKKSGEQAEVVPFSAKIEAELAELPLEDRADFLSSLGLESAGLDLCFSAIGASASLELVPHAVRGGAVAIDKSSAWRMKLPRAVVTVGFGISSATTGPRSASSQA